METTTLNHTGTEEREKTRLDLWQESVGKVFKLVTKSYCIRTVVYTQVKGVKETGESGEFEVHVQCAEITARILDGRRAHSSASKEGVIHHNAESVLLPSGFGEECAPDEFDRITTAILIYSTTILDAAVHPESGEAAPIEAPIDLPHLKLTEMEASLVRSSPFLVKSNYLISVNSCKVAFEAINEDLRRAARNTRLTDASDAVYVDLKNQAVASLRQKLNTAVLALGHPVANPAAAAKASSTPPAPTARPATTPPILPRKESRLSLNPFAAGIDGRTAVVKSGSGGIGVRRTISPELDNAITLALRGRPSPAMIYWERQNPSSEGAVFRTSKDCGLLEFAGWSDVSGRMIPHEQATASGRKVSSYFRGDDANYTGPDKDGIYPLFRP